MKNDVNVASKNLAGSGSVGQDSEVLIPGSGSVPICHGSATLPRNSQVNPDPRSLSASLEMLVGKSISTKLKFNKSIPICVHYKVQNFLFSNRHIKTSNPAELSMSDIGFSF